MLALTLTAFLTAGVADISIADAARHLRADPAAFAEADRDGDGRIDDAELERVRQALADGNRSEPAGAVLHHAAVRTPLPFVGPHDRDANGTLIPAELYTEAR